MELAGGREARKTSRQGAGRSVSHHPDRPRALSYGELAGEASSWGDAHDPRGARLLLRNTHYSHYYDEVGMLASGRQIYRTDAPSSRAASQYARECARGGGRLDEAFQTRSPCWDQKQPPTAERCYDQLICR